MLVLTAARRILSRRSVAMPTRSFDLTPELDGFIAAKVQEGMFKDPSGMVRAALRLLEREVREHEATVEALDHALDHAAAVAEGDVFSEVRQELGMPARSAVA